MPAIPETVHRCRLLVDGYNLLFGQGWALPGSLSHRSLQRGREVLAERLASRVPAENRSQVWIVFDAFDAPSHLPTAIAMRDMQVLFSRDWASADELLQQILVLHPSAKTLAVISSDHTVQRKAVARGARAYDHEQWESAVDIVFGSAANPPEAVEESESGKNRAVGEQERDDWMKRFGF